MNKTMLLSAFVMLLISAGLLLFAVNVEASRSEKPVTMTENDIVKFDNWLKITTDHLKNEYSWQSSWHRRYETVVFRLGTELDAYGEWELKMFISAMWNYCVPGKTAEITVEHTGGSFSFAVEAVRSTDEESVYHYDDLVDLGIMFVHEE